VAERVPFTDLSSMTREVRAEVDTAMARVLDRGAFVGGEEVDRFEQEWAGYCGTRFAIGVANGTDALALTLRALGIGPGDEVVVPTNTFVATAEAVLLVGATPRFADVSDETLLLTPDGLRAAMTPRSRAVIVVHLYGQMADMDALGRVAASAGLVVIEDAAQAHGATWNGRRAGSFGRAGCFSFYPAKNLGAFGDAGAVVTDDPDLANLLRCLRDHGRTAGSHHRHDVVGTNSRLDTLQAAVLTAKLPRLDAWTAARRTLAAAYRDHLDGGPVRLVAEAPASGSVHHLLVARVPARERVADDLARTGVRVGVHYPVPCHRQHAYRQYASGPLPVAEQAAREVLSLPMFPHMTQDQVALVCTELQALVAGEAQSHDV
jgi:dTDP-4-amino-4,6-dideoxygalactose transaminase